EIDEVLLAAHGVAGFLVPRDERCVRNGLGQLRNLDLDAHGVSTLSAFGFDARRVYQRAKDPRRVPSRMKSTQRKPMIVAAARAGHGYRMRARRRLAGPRKRARETCSTGPACGDGSDTRRLDSAALPGTTRSLSRCDSAR